jgi:hypothetical protein
LEIWRDVPGFSGELQASDSGKLRTIDRRDVLGRFRKGVELKFEKHRTGYLRVKISHRRVQKTYSVHRLIALTFLPNPENKPEVNHKDSNRANNAVSNLEWSTKVENIEHAYEHGALENPYGETARHFKYRVLVIDKNGNIVDVLIGKTDMENKGYQSSLVYHCLNGKQKTHKGFTFKREYNGSSTSST